MVLEPRELLTRDRRYAYTESACGGVCGRTCDGSGHTPAANREPRHAVRS